MEKGQVPHLTVAEKPLGEACEKVGEDIFPGDPDQGSRNERSTRERNPDPPEYIGESSPGKRHEDDQDEVDEAAENGRQAAVMGGDIRDPVEEDGAIDEAADESDAQGLGWRFLRRENRSGI